MLFVPAALEVLAKIKRTTYTASCHFSLRLELSHNAVKNKVCYVLAVSLYYSLNKKTNLKARSHRCSQKKCKGPAPPQLNATIIKNVTTKPIVYLISVFFLAFLRTTVISSVARGGGGYSPPPIGMESMQNTLFLALLRPIFALEAKIAPHWHWQ